MLTRVLSLDLATRTGWAFTFCQTRSKFEYGIIQTNPKFSEGRRLALFREELIKLLSKLKPTHIVIEDTYAGNNIKTLKLLSKYAGVAIECCSSMARVNPYIIHTSTVKAYFKVKNKKDLFDFMLSLLEWEDDKGISFEKHNDITDAIAQLLCYCDKILGLWKFRVEKEYGFLYNV